MAAVDDGGGSVSSNEFSEENTDYVGEPVMSGQDVLSETPDPGADDADADAGDSASEPHADADSSSSEQVAVEPSAPGPTADERLP
jgi:hypothetical protein